MYLLNCSLNGLSHKLGGRATQICSQFNFGLQKFGLANRERCIWPILQCSITFTTC